MTRASRLLTFAAFALGGLVAAGLAWAYWTGSWERNRERRRDLDHRAERRHRHRKSGEHDGARELGCHHRSGRQRDRRLLRAAASSVRHRARRAEPRPVALLGPGDHELRRHERAERHLHLHRDRGVSFVDGDQRGERRR